MLAVMIGLLVSLPPILASEHNDQDGDDDDDNDREGQSSGAAACLAPRRGREVHRGVRRLVAGRWRIATASVIGIEGSHIRHPVVVVERLPPVTVL
jgi:hypothetical protein